MLDLERLVSSTSDISDIEEFTRKYDALPSFQKEVLELPDWLKWSYLHDLSCSNYDLSNEWYVKLLTEFTIKENPYRSSAMKLLKEIRNNTI